MQKCALAALAACTQGGTDLTGAASAADEGADALAVAAMRALPGEAAVQMNGCALLACLSLGWRHSPDTRPFADGAVAAAVAAFRAAAAAAATGRPDEAAQQLLPTSATALSNMTLRFPACAAQAAEAGAVAVAVDVLQSRSAANPQVAAPVAFIIANVVGSCPWVPLGAAPAALEAALALHGGASPSGGGGGEAVTAIRDALEKIQLAKVSGGKKRFQATSAGAPRKQTLGSQAGGAGAAAGAAALSTQMAELLAGTSCAQCGARAAAGGAALKSCALCHEVSYCSKECQRAAWKAHKPLCNKK